MLTYLRIMAGPGVVPAEVWYVGDLSGVINIPSIGFWSRALRLGVVYSSWWRCS